MQLRIINLVIFIFIKSREYQRTLLGYICSFCAKLEDNYTSLRRLDCIWLLMVNYGEYVFRKVAQLKGVVN